MRAAGRALGVLGAVWLLLGAATPAVAAPHDEAHDVDRLVWQQRLEASELERREAHERLVSARAAHRRALLRRPTAEAPLEASADAVSRAEARLADAEHRQRRLLERARRAGVPESWLAPVSAPLPAATAD